MLEEVKKEFLLYESALCKNDVKAFSDSHLSCCPDAREALDRFFFDNPSTVRFGTAENLYGYEAAEGTKCVPDMKTRVSVSAQQAIRAFREGRSPPGDRRILRSLITTYGPDFAVPHLTFFGK